MIDKLQVTLFGLLDANTDKSLTPRLLREQAEVAMSMTPGTLLSQRTVIAELIYQWHQERKNSSIIIGPQTPLIKGRTRKRSLPTSTSLIVDAEPKHKCSSNAQKYLPNSPACSVLAAGVLSESCTLTTAAQQLMPSSSSEPLDPSSPASTLLSSLLHAAGKHCTQLTTADSWRRVRRDFRLSGVGKQFAKQHSPAKLDQLFCGFMDIVNKDNVVCGMLMTSLVEGHDVSRKYVQRKFGVLFEVVMSSNTDGDVIETVVASSVGLQVPFSNPAAIPLAPETTSVTVVEEAFPPSASLVQDMLSEQMDNSCNDNDNEKLLVSSSGSGSMLSPASSQSKLETSRAVQDKRREHKLVILQLQKDIELAKQDIERARTTRRIEQEIGRVKLLQLMEHNRMKHY